MRANFHVVPAVKRSVCCKDELSLQAGSLRIAHLLMTVANSITSRSAGRKKIFIEDRMRRQNSVDACRPCSKVKTRGID